MDFLILSSALIKSALSLKYKQIPPSIHLLNPNRNIDWLNSPVYVNTKLTPWRNQNKNMPLRCGVSSFGVSGTNCHVILEENRYKDLEIFEKNNINYGVLDVEEWLDCAKIKQNNRGVEGNKEIYKLCCAKNMLTLSDGKLFRCPYAANAHRLHAVPDYKEDYVDIFEDSVNENNLQQIKNKIKEYVLNKDYLEICDFCNGRPLSGVEVEPSVQISKPLEYKEYS